MHGWDSHSSVRWLCAIFLRETLGYNIEFVDSRSIASFKTFENIANGILDIDAEVWAASKQEAYNKSASLSVHDSFDIKSHSLHHPPPPIFGASVVVCQVCCSGTTGAGPRGAGDSGVGEAVRSLRPHARRRVPPP